MDVLMKAVPPCGTGWQRLSRRSALRAAVLIAGTLLGAGVIGSATTARAEGAAPGEIHIDNFAFTPAEITVAPGTTVTWLNRDDIPHTVAEKGLSFKSKPMDTDESFTHTFDKAGEFEYFCSLHPHMTGKVIVKAP